MRNDYNYYVGKSPQMPSRKAMRRKSTLKAILTGVGGLLLAMLVMLYTISFLSDSFNMPSGAEIVAVIPTEAPNQKPDDELAEIDEDILELIEDEPDPYKGELELPVNGATGYAPVTLNLTALAHADSAVVTKLNPGTAFLILKEQGDWWEVKVGEHTGWVRHANCMINLPDVIPSIVYNNTNTVRSVFTAVYGIPIPGITNEELYKPGKIYNERLGRNEYIMATMYTMAKRVYVAQQAALADGYALYIHETFRPASVQRLVYEKLSNLASVNAEVMSGFGDWGIHWFIARGTSTHQEGCAMDVSLVKVNEMKEVTTGSYKFKQPSMDQGGFKRLTMPSFIHELSAESAAFVRPFSSTSLTEWQYIPLSESMQNYEYAVRLQRYCTDAGFTPIASEWWHFNDLYARKNIPQGSVGNYMLTECLSVPPQ